MRRISYVCACIVALAAVIMLASCSEKLGYAVLLWSIPEEQLFASEVVTVHIKSNISQVYVISSVQNPDKKFEVPLWKISEPTSHSKAQDSAQKMNAHKYTYARVLLDGLPIRSQPDNTAASTRVYRLRENEIIKVLQKGRHEIMSGSTEMAGDWLYVISDDGTTGWCFSYNLQLFDERNETGNEELVEVEADDKLDFILKSRWYPQSYKTMIEAKRVVPENYNEQWGFFIGSDTGFTRIVQPDVDMLFPFVGITKENNDSYRFTDTTVSMQLHKDMSLTVQYTDNTGKSKSFVFTTLKESIASLVQGEIDRRSQAYYRLCTLGPIFNSNSYGVLQFLQNGSFLWSGYQLLVPSIIPKTALNKGTVDIRFFVHPSLAHEYDGVLSFKFDGTDSLVHFLYKMETTGLRLEYVSESNIKDSTVTKRNANPFILYFNVGSQAQ